MTIKILFFGDIVGRVGRRGVIGLLPELRKKYQPDLVIANGENLAHGLGVTEKTLDEAMAGGIDFFTSGNHVWNKGRAEEILEGKIYPIIRPANYPPNVPGLGCKIVEVKKNKILIINLIGRVFFAEKFDCPFRALDQILNNFKGKKLAGVIVDLHAEATSEKMAMGHYADGRISALLGTHTHVQTSDAQILPQGTAYITDAGMAGAKDSIIGDIKANVLESFLTQRPYKLEVAESGRAMVNGVFLEIDSRSKKAIKIESFTLFNNVTDKVGDLR